MVRYHPKTTLRLILYGFGVVTLPLLVALGAAMLYMDRLLDQSQNAVYKAVQATRDSRILTQQVITLERHGRQYLLLQDAALLEAYHGTRSELTQTVSKISQLTLDGPQQTLIDEFVTVELALVERMSATESPAVLRPEAVAADFNRLNELAHRILAGSNGIIDREVEAMRETGASAQRLLGALTAALIPLTLLSIGVCTLLISQPIRQVDRAIRTLGDGDFNQAVQVSGPQDLQHLGKRLDWLRQRLWELENQKTRFLQHISHELKTPLTAIRESVDLICDRVVGPLNDQQAEIAQILRSNARQLQGLIEDLLNFGTAQTHSAVIHRQRVELPHVIEQVIQNHKPALLAKNLELERDLHAASVAGDREKLATVIDNLLSNAIKYSPPGGRIRLSLYSSEKFIELAVTDQGPGIEADDGERIFEAFYQGRQPAAGHVKGSGLGLSIAREYVTAHGGEIGLVPQEERGARFVVRLPATLEHEPQT